jgi:hypothetical protein
MIAYLSVDFNARPLPGLGEVEWVFSSTEDHD